MVYKTNWMSPGSGYRAVVVSLDRKRLGGTGPGSEAEKLSCRSVFDKETRRKPWRLRRMRHLRDWSPVWCWVAGRDRRWIVGLEGWEAGCSGRRPCRVRQTGMMVRLVLHTDTRTYGRAGSTSGFRLDSIVSGGIKESTSRRQLRCSKRPGYEHGAATSRTSPRVKQRRFLGGEQ